jgi:hypothetical protein
MDGFLMKNSTALADPDGVTDPICLTERSWRRRLRRASGQAAEAVAVISSIVVVGLVYAVL